MEDMHRYALDDYFYLNDFSKEIKYCLRCKGTNSFIHVCNGDVTVHESTSFAHSSVLD